MTDSNLTIQQQLEEEYEELVHFLSWFKDDILETEHHDNEIEHLTMEALGKTPDELENEEENTEEETDKYQEIYNKYWDDLYRDLDSAETFKQILQVQFLKDMAWDVDYLDAVHEDKFSRALEIEELLEMMPAQEGK